MVALLLPVIYIAFISLGLPDSILGSAWPSMYRALNVPMAYAGVLTMIIATCTILSSLFSEKLIRWLGTGLVTALSVALTALALFGFSVSGSFAALCLWGIPYGLGAGSVDSALNNYVALHYQSRHMNWLHCCWGVGASIGPYVMGYCLTNGMTWGSGYQAISVFQAVLVLLMLASLPLWAKQKPRTSGTHAGAAPHRMLDGLRLPGALQTLLAFFCYCAMETTAGLWASSYMVLQRGIARDVAASMAALFYLGITGGRLLSGFAAAKMGDRRMVQLGIGVIAVGLLLLILPLGNELLVAGLVFTGLGCAPIYPSLLHQTPENFGAERSQMLMGIQMATAYTGSTLMPPLFGLMAQYLSMALYPYFLAVFLVGMLWMTQRASRIFVARQVLAAE